MWVSALLVVFGCFFAETNAQCGSFAFASYYADHMVLQQSPASAVVWGYANSAGLQVTVNMLGVEYSVTSTDGPTGVPVWSAQLDSQTSPGPVNITATEAGCSVSLTDVLFGDVYVCSGQSNMQFRMSELDDPDQDIADAINYPNIRTFMSSLEYSETAQYDLIAIDRNWVVPTDTNMAQFSALCWLFGRDLNVLFDRPIGLIQSSWGGTRIEAWSSPEALDVCFPGGLPPTGDQNSPSVLWNAMIHPFLNIPIYGAIWYQGESNQGNYEDYDCAIQSMVNDWRGNFYDRSGQTMDPQFPFGQVQLAPNGPSDTNMGFSNVRWAQTYNQGYTPNNDLQKIFTAVAVDLPDFDSPSGSIHPRYKRQIAERMTYGVYQVGYGITTEGPFQGPLPTSAVVDAQGVTITYDDGAANIEVRTPDNFEVCCADVSTDRCPDGAGVWTLTTIASNTASSVTLTNPCSNLVTGMRYAWRESPCPLEMCAVYGVENELPAPPYVMDIN